MILCDRLFWSAFEANRKMALQATTNNDDRESPPARECLGSINGPSAARARMMEALLELVDEGGSQAVTITALVARARVSRHTFYAQFETAEHCLLATARRMYRRAGGRRWPVV
jgi:AcrR family transcriptional regulator